VIPWGTIANVATVIVGGLLGCIAGSRLGRRFSEAAFRGIGLFTLVIGMSMALRTGSFLILAFSCISGSLAGEALQVDAGLRRLGTALGRRLSFGGERFSEGMVAAFLLFCMGSMTVLGAVEEGMGRSSELLMTKALMDGFAAAIMASALGPGVIFSVIPLAIYQGGLTLIAAWAGGGLPGRVVTEVSAVGGVLLAGLGIEILGIRKMTSANMLPALVFAGVLAAVT
jgi:uncharacterized membrane protein YqgA involved in biofilm formation